MRPGSRPFVLAYLFLISLILAIMVRRAPEEAVTAAAAQPSAPATAKVTSATGSRHDQAPPLPAVPRRQPTWLELFRPSQRTALQLLRAGLPFLVEADGKSQEQKIALLVYRTGPGEQAPKSFLQTLLPFLQEETPTKSVPPVAGRPPEESPPDPKVPRSKRAAPPQPLVGIYHTHDWESYLSEFPGLQLKEPQDLDKISSEDHKRRTVVDLGQTLATLLSQQGVVTVHSEQRHQHLKYENAYLLSRITAEQILKEEPSTRVLLDIHRDAVWEYTPVVKVNGQQVARIRCVIGKLHPNWEANATFCSRLKLTLEKRYPGLTLETLVKEDRYNQDLHPGAILLEIGTATNSYEEAERAIALLANGIAELVTAP